MSAEPQRVVWTPNGWIPSDAPAPAGMVAYRFPRSLPVVQPAEVSAEEFPRRPRVRQGHPRNYGRRR